MKKYLFVIALSFFCIAAFSQSYMGTVTKTVNLRAGAGKEFTVLKSLPAGTQIFINSLDTINGFYSVIDIATNTEGYVHYSFVKTGERVRENKPGVFIPSGTSSSVQPEIEIYNKTNLTLTLKLNSDLYTFKPYEKRTIKASKGACNYRASAPGVVPYIGNEQLEGNMQYSWTFYIVTY